MSALEFDMRPPPEAETPLSIPEAEPPPLPRPVPDAEKPISATIEDEDEDEDEVEDIEFPELPQKKEKLRDEEVFSPPKVAPVKKPKRKRKPPTPEQLERLAEARKKAFEVKAQKKRERDEMKALAEKVAQKKKEKIEEDIINNLDEDELPESFKQKRVSKPSVPSITQEDLRKAIAEGVEIYDTKRKAQKKIKKENQEKERKQKEVVQQIQKAIDPNSFWDQYLR